MKVRNKFTVLFEKFSAKVTKATGSSTAFIMAFAVIIAWVITGPVFNFSNTWQLVINTGTTIAKELETIKDFYKQLAELAKKENDIHKTHSIDEARTKHQSKKEWVKTQAVEKPSKS